MLFLLAFGQGRCTFLVWLPRHGSERGWEGLLLRIHRVDLRHWQLGEKASLVTCAVDTLSLSLALSLSLSLSLSSMGGGFLTVVAYLSRGRLPVWVCDQCDFLAGHGWAVFGPLPGEQLAVSKCQVNFCS